MADFAADNFDGIGSANLGGRTASDGGTWTDREGGASAIRGDSADGIESTGTNASQGSTFYHSGVPGSADYEVSMDVKTDASNRSTLAVAGRCATGSRQEYFAYYQQTNGWGLFRDAGSGVAQLGSFVNSNVPTTTKRLTLRMVGSAISVHVAGATNPIISVTNTDITAAGKAGVTNYYAENAQQNCDNFNAGPIPESAPQILMGQAIL